MSRSLTSLITELASRTLMLKPCEYRAQLVGDLLRNHPVKEILNEAIRMSIHHLSDHEIKNLFSRLNDFCDKKHKKAIRHARNVALGIDEQKKNSRNSNRKVVRMMFELEQMEACACDDLEAQGLFDVNMNIHHKVDDRVTNIMQTMEKGISSFFGGQNITSFKNKLIRFVLVIFECISSSSLASKMRMLTSFLIDFEWTSCAMQEYAGVLAQVLKRPFWKNEEELEAQMDCDTAKKCIQGTMVVLASMLSIKPYRNDVTMTSTAKLNAISKSVKSIENIWKFVTEMFGESLTNLLLNMGFSVPETVLSLINEEIVSWMQEIDALPDGLDIEINGNYVLADQVVLLKKKGDEFFNDLQRMRVNSTIMTLFQNKYNYIRNYAKKAAPHFFNDKMREAPFVIHLHGNSGIGKSTVQNFLVNELMKKMVDDGKVKSFDHGRDIYVRNNDQDHWDGYHNQPVVFFDDFMQTRDTESRTNELNELIRVKNTTAYPLKMASLEDKGNTRFTSKLVVISSNLDFTSDKKILRDSIECPTAIQRRIDVSARVTIFKKHCDEDGKLDIFTLNDRTKRFDESIYGFVCRGQAMNYPMFVQYCYDTWRSINMQDTALIEVLPKWTGSSLQPEKLMMSELHMDRLEAQWGDNMDERERAQIQRHIKVSHEHLNIIKILGHYGYKATMSGHHIHLANSDKIVNDLNNDGIFVDGVGKITFDQETQTEGERIAVCDRCKKNRSVKQDGVSQTFVRKFERGVQAPDVYVKKFYLPRTQTQRGVENTMRFVTSQSYTHIVDQPQGKTFTISEWYADQMQRFGWVNDSLEAQWGFSKIDIDPELDKIDEHELFLINYALSNDEEEPCEDWKQSMKDRFWELKKSVTDKTCETYTKLKEAAQKQYDKFMENNSWYKVGLGIVSVLGFVGTLLTAYHFCTKESEQSEASVSGDQRTMVQTRRYVSRSKMSKSAEVSVSGDQKTVTQVRRYARQQPMRSEASVSGDQKTIMHMRKYANVSAEAAVDRNLYDGQLFNEDRSVEAQQSSDPNAHALMGNLIYNNVAKVTCKGCTINGLFLCDTILMLPRHMMLIIGDGDEFVIKTRHHTHVVNIDDCEYEEDKDRDVAFVRCPQRIGGYCSLVKHFHSLRELEKVNIDVGVLCGTRDTKDGTTMIMMMATNLRPRVKIEYPARYGGQVLEQCCVLKGFEYKSQTMRGDCGAPLIALHNGLTKKILGIHTAGATNLGISNSLDQDYINEWVHKFDKVIKPEIPLLNSDPLEAHSAVHEDDKVEVLGKVDRRFGFRIGDKSTIVESPLHGIFPVETKPAMLKPDGDINPLRIALKTQFVEQISFPQDVVDMAVQDLKLSIISYSTAYVGRGLLSDHAVLNGIAGDQWIRPMNMKTSPGFPYINIKRTKAGKFDFLLGDVGNYVLDEFTSDMVRLREKQAAIGEIPTTLFCDTLKDERRAIEKVDEGKTRVFNTAPFDLSFLVRKYFGNFIAHIMDNNVHGECSVGVDPHSDKWTLMYEHLDIHGHNWIAGDFSKYDKTLSFQLICGALEVINAWYNDEHDFIRKTLFYTMFNATHLTGNTVYRVHQGNPSGIPLTVIINSLVNSLLSRITYTLISRDQGYRSDMESFHKFIRVKNYGDDNIGKVNKRCHWYNMITIRDCLASYGIKYTPPTKGDVVCEYLDRKEISYLKREFVQRGARVWAPLDMTSIREMIMWSRSDSPFSPEEAVQANFASAMREMVHYGPDEFKKFQDFVTLAAARRELHLKAFSFSDLEKEMTEGYACDLANGETDYNHW